MQVSDEITHPTIPTRRPKEPFGVIKRNKFIEAYRQTSNIRASCEYASICRDTYYWTMENDSDFAERVRVAELEAIDRLEAKAWNNALVKDSETSLWNLLKAHRPGKYREATNRNININLTAQELANLSDEDLDRLIDTLARGA